MKKQKLEELVSLLVDGSFIAEKDIKKAKDYAEKHNQELTETLVSLGFIRDNQLGQLTAEINGWKFTNLSSQKIDEIAMKKIPEQFSRSKLALIYAETDDSVEVAMNDPEDTHTIHLIKKQLKKKINPHYSTKNDILDKLSLYKIDIKQEFENMLQAQAKAVENGEESSNMIINAVNLLLDHGYSRGASDIHIEPQDEQIWIRFRIDGIMHDILNIPRKFHDHVVTRIKVMAKLRTDERNTPQDGKLKYKVFNEDIDVRVSTVPTTQGEKIVLRLLVDHNKSFSLEDLGLNKDDLKKVLTNIHKPWGMILVTGPTGSGKTTSLYAAMKLINSREINITTIEDPVEYNLNGITQIQVNPNADLTFASGLKSIVRQDPDVVMVGEIRDKETAAIAVNSALTGHLVLSTLHTNDAATTLVRLLEMDIEPFLVTSTVNVAIGQRLVRKICMKCIHSIEMDVETLKSKLPEHLIQQLMSSKGEKSHVRVYQGAGCPVCRNTGYSGRIGVFEVMEIDDNIRQLIMNNASADKIRAQAIKNGMRTLVDDAINKVKEGVTTIEEILRVIKS